MGLVVMLIVDPPSGWMYGFPQPLDSSVPYKEQLRRNKYPEEDIEFAVEHSRYWEYNDGN